MSKILAEKLCRSFLLIHRNKRESPSVLGNVIRSRQCLFSSSSSSSSSSTLPTKRSTKQQPESTDEVGTRVSADIPPLPLIMSPPDKVTDFHRTISEALRSHYDNQTPVILRGFLHHNDQWVKAMVNWKDLKYLSSRIKDESMMRAEIGHYDSGDVCELPFGNYAEYLTYFANLYGEDIFQVGVDGKLKPPGGQILYMAQNDIPPLLLEDICVPRVCSDPSFGFGEGRQYHIMFWMGPPYAFSPLHFDPMDNLLFQVTGRKQVIVVDPKKANERNMYVGNQSNTSTVHDLESVDRKRFPHFPDMSLVGHRGVLKPGDVLFLPAKYWHSTKSLDFSISVNSWWR